MARRLASRKSPFLSGGRFGYVGFTLGAEANDVRNIALAFQTDRRVAIDFPARFKMRLCSDAAGTTLATPLTHRAYAGTAGQFIEGTDHLRDGLIAKSTLIIDATNTAQFSTSATATFRVKGVTATKAAAVDLTFTANHVVTASKWGAILVQCNVAGTISTLVGEATQTTPMAYNTSALAIAALPQPAVGNIALGYILIENNTGDWTANTDDLVAASDLETVAFVDATEQIGPVTFEGITTAAGAFNFNLRESGTKTVYLGVELPDGTVQMSSAIAFA